MNSCLLIVIDLANDIIDFKHSDFLVKSGINAHELD